MFIQENQFETVVWKMMAILSRPQYVKELEIIRVMYVWLGSGTNAYE